MITILFLSLCLAFCWVEFINSWLQIGFSFSIHNPFAHKPLNCTKCMTGWFALAIGLFVEGWPGIMYLPLGVFIGAMFEAIKMRYL